LFASALIATPAVLLGYQFADLLDQFLRETFGGLIDLKSDPDLPQVRHIVSICCCSPPDNTPAEVSCRAFRFGTAQNTILEIPADGGPNCPRA